MNTKTILCLLAAACLTACSSDDDEQITPTERPLTVVVGENPMPEEDAEGRNAPATRGTLITTDNLSSFSMNYGSNLYTVEKSENGWTTSPSDWPYGVGNDEAITFYAYNGGTYYHNSGTPYLSYTMDANVSDTKDLLVAKSEAVSYNGTNGTVPLTFDHACVALDFQVIITSALAETNPTVTINSIVLQGIYDKGDYYFESKTWSNLRNSEGFSGLTLNNSSISINTAQTLSCATLFLIPQQVNTETAKIVINFSDGQKNSIALHHGTNTSNAVNWSTPCKKTVTIKIGTNLYNGRR